MRILLFFVAAVLLSQNAWPPPGMSCPQRTVVTFDEGPNASKSQELFQQHVTYLLGQMKAGKVIAAGPMAAGHTALMIFASKDWDEVQDVLKAEPFTQAGVIQVVRHEVWNSCELAK